MTLEMKMDEMFDKGVELGEQRGMERGMTETEQKLVNNLMVNMSITEEEARERLGICPSVFFISYNKIAISCKKFSIYEKSHL